MAAQIRRDLYAEVTSRILAELDRGAAPWVKPWSATPGQNVPQNAVTNRPLLRLQRYPVMVHARPRLANASIRHVQTSARGWRQRA